MKTFLSVLIACAAGNLFAASFTTTAAYLGMLNPRGGPCLFTSDDFESYADAAALNGLSGPGCWSAAYNDATGATGVQSYDTFESYTDAYLIDTLNGGIGNWLTPYNTIVGPGLIAYDDMEQYSDAIKFDKLSLGGVWASAYNAVLTPDDMGSLAYYWNYSDLPATGAVSNWVDRVQAKPMNQGAAAKQPTNSATGVWFNAGTCVTNNFTLPQSKFSIWISFQIPSSQGSFAGLVNDSGGSSGFYISSLALRYYPSAAIASLASGVQYDFVFANPGTAVANAGLGWTNGVATGTCTDHNTAQPIVFFGSDNAAENYKGYIKFVAIWTNRVLAASDATYLYGYGSTH